MIFEINYYDLIGILLYATWSVSVWTGKAVPSLHLCKSHIHSVPWPIRYTSI